ncbi:MAG: hypothetical protein H8E66_07975 [Planctomycetes bacterium]|nr:hypothetical protein [Planctomycetota bacterium]
MTHYEFDPDPKRKRGRNKYVGSWTETPAPPIELPFAANNLSRLLTIGGDPADSTYTHQQIVRWCELYFWHFDDDLANRDRTPDVDVAEDVFVQWDLFLHNTYKLAELQGLDFTVITLPNEWFADWHAKLPIAEGG